MIAFFHVLAAPALEAAADCGLARSIVGEDVPVSSGAPPKAASDANGNNVATSIAIFKTFITMLLRK
ncbi:hypothetical protein NE850_38300 [Paraburkholderia sp. USG1]|uniref:hypothetical protein n=1 Tax=Paraburkholderia sp. USG1 TaxID=2952268 RepID=UPI0028678351|nr:hypothetical protein [Paraburkholderia sp. USG1]MDR8402178.1 hypothetical protein [Paraburkholderia sp. USG1]